MVAKRKVTAPSSTRPKGKQGNPKNWEPSPELEDAICLRLSEGESLRKICIGEDMPSRATVLRWQNENPAFEAKCARAREGQADWLSDDMAEIEARVLSGELDPQAARVVLSSKQWRASKLAPKKYGDKQQVEHSGGVTVTHEAALNDLE